MKTSKLLIYGTMLLVLSLSVFGQRNKTDPRMPADTDTERSRPGGHINAGTTIEATLANTLDARNARIGDTVTLRASKSVKQDGQTIIPKGASLLGRVTDVQRRTKQDPVSRLGIAIESVTSKGVTSPISVAVVAIGQAASSVSAGDDLFASTSGGGGAQASSGGGGLLGGVTSTVANVAGSTPAIVNGVVNSTAGTVTGAANGVGGTAGGMLPGLQISNSISGSANAGSTITASDRNVRIEKGAVFHLRTGPPNQ